MTLYALENVDDAIDATRSFLWPFDLGRWLKLAFVVFFLGGTGAVNPFQFGGGTSSTESPGEPGQLPSYSEIVNALTPTEWAIVGAIVGTILLLGLILGFIGAVMEFVFVESLRRERVSIREYWGARWRQGVRLFGFRLVVGLLSLAVAGGAIVAALWPLFAGGQFSVAVLLLAIGVALVVAMISGLLTGFTTQFVVPVMVAEDRTVLGAWKRFWPTMTGQWKEYLAYAVLRIVLSIAVSILVGVVTAIGLVVLAIPLVMVGIAGGVLLSVSDIVGGAVLLVVVALFFVAVIAISLVIAVPVQTYLRYYALLVLGDTEEAFDLVAERRRAIRE
ncbi:DUF7544 domain-containing protein [Halolamina sediminis]|jgi:hypothetical protein|uniref:DUF7544 domain-containing protein n=1 Tax=Halolamina sediminis TaxID=1480675 RepID=UPI0006B5EBE9|nr:hypothetical protein [Halolamina sediminis]